MNLTTKELCFLHESIAHDLNVTVKDSKEYKFVMKLREKIGKEIIKNYNNESK